jgi:photosystem II stability/assembly factor-like uncharacterized protein
MATNSSPIPEEGNMTSVHLLVGTTNGLFIYRSNATRIAWQVDGPLLAGWSIDSVLGDSRHGPRIFAGASHATYPPTVRLSEDGEQSWSQLRHGPRYARESGLTLHRIWQISPGAASQPETYYAGVDEAGLFVSRDCGITWQEVLGLNRYPTRGNWRGSRGGLCLHTICIDPVDPQRMWVAISAAGILRTEDGGETWRPCNRGLRPSLVDGAGDDGFLVHKLVLDPQQPTVLYLQDFTGLYRSTDGADSWQPFEAGLPSGFGFPLCIDTTSALFAVPLDLQTRSFLGGQLRVYRRRPQESAWELLENGLPTAQRSAGVLRDALAVDSLTPSSIYLGTTQGELFYSANGGDQWAQLPGQVPRVTALGVWVREDG